MSKSSGCSTSLPTLDIMFYVSHSGGCVVVVIVALISIFLIWNMKYMKYVHYLHDIVKGGFECFVHFSIELLLFFLLICRFLCLNRRPLPAIWTADIFPHSFLSSLFTVCFDKCRFLILMEFNLSIFPLLLAVLVSYLRNLWLPQ